jgi:hypothetical protein
VIGRIGETALRLGFAEVREGGAVDRVSANKLAEVEERVSMEQIRRFVPEVNTNMHLRAIALESLKGVKEIRRRLTQEYGKISIIGKGEGRHPDLAGIVQPDYIAFAAGHRDPIVIEAKCSVKATPADDFQARYYNGIAQKFGLYLIQERLEGQRPVLSPKIVNARAETLLVYLRQASYKVVKDTYVPDKQTIREVWKAKTLGLRGLLPETDCAADCAHHRLLRNLKMTGGNMDPLAPPPLILSEGLLRHDYDLDTEYQVKYARRVLPRDVRNALLWQNPVNAESSFKKWSRWLVDVVGLSQEAAAASMEPNTHLRFFESKPDAQKLFKSLKDELYPWQQILKKRIRMAAPVILGRATAIYALPRKSVDFVKGAWKRWQ